MDESAIYLQQAVTMLNSEIRSAERERWLDWVLARILDPQTTPAKINPCLRVELFSILSTVFLREIHKVSETHSTDECSDFLLAYILKGRGCPLILSMGLVPDRGPCPLELCILFLFLATRLKTYIGENNIESVCIEPCEPVVFGNLSVPSARVLKKRRGRSRRRTGIPGFPDSAERQSSRQIENLAQYEAVSESDTEEESSKSSVIRVYHIDYLKYFDNGDIESESIVGSCKVAPPASFPDLLRPSSGSGPPEDSQPSVPLETRLLTEVLRLAGCVTGGTWSPTTEKDWEHVLQIISVTADLIKMPSVNDLLTELELRVLVNSVSSLRFSPNPVQLLQGQGLRDLETVMGEPKCTSLEAWPSVCLEIIQLFQHISNTCVSREAQMSLTPSSHSSVFFGLSKQILEAVAERRESLSLRSSGAIVKLFRSILTLHRDSDIDTRRLWSDLALRILSLSVVLQPRHSQIQVIHCLTEFAQSRKVSPETLFQQVRRLVEFSGCGSEVTEAYLAMLEKSIENLTDSWDEDVVEAEDEFKMDLQVTTDSGSEDNNIKGDDRPGFGSYLVVLLSQDSSSKELVISHLDSIICTLRSELRLQLATEVILPYLNERLESEEEDRNVLVSVLDLLCSLVKEQPTAMALIREQRAWSCVKRFGSKGGELSSVCQQIIKTLILNSNKFKKIRLSEAEAMALQDDENDRINFDERDRNAQYWLFKQLYHVLVQSSNTVLVSGWPALITHLTTAWQVTLELVRRVPEFFLFAVERGITDINLRLADSLLSEAGPPQVRDFADLLGTLISFQVYVIVNFASMNEEILHTNINQTKELLTGRMFSKMRTLLQRRVDLRFCRVLLSSVLESSYVTELRNQEGERHRSHGDDWAESGYEADESESACCLLKDSSAKRNESYRITFANSFHFFVDSFLEMFEVYREESELIYTLEYLLFKLLNNCAKCKENANLFNEENGLTRIFSAVHALLDSSLRLDNVCDMLLELTGHIAAVRILPSTLRLMFQFLARQNQLQERMLLSVSRLFRDCCSRQEFPGITVVQNVNRFRAVSANSSDSGLDSANSSVAASPIPSLEVSQSRSFSFHDDIGQDYAVVLRVKLAPEVKKDCWLTIITIENQTETIGLHINVKKGLKLTLANAVETIAAAETTFKSMLFPDQWIHLAFNLGTISEGKRETKTLTAFVNCQKVWGVGLCVDKVVSKVRKKEVTVTVGPQDTITDMCHSSLIYNDIHILKNCILSQENVILNYICGPRDFNGSYAPDEVCFEEIRKYLPDLFNSCTKIVSEPRVLRQHLELAASVVAHFSPFSFWRKSVSRTEDAGCESWSLLDGLLKAGGAEAVAMLPLEAVEKGLSSQTVSECLSNCLAVLTSNQTMYDEFKKIGGFSLVGSILSSKSFTPDFTILQVLLSSSSFSVGTDKVLFYPQILEVCLQHLERFEGEASLAVMVKVLDFISELLADTNPALELNIEIMKKYKIFDSILASLQTFGESSQDNLPVENISNLLSALPSTSEFLVKMMNLVLSTLPPYLLYLPYLSRSLLHVTMVKEKKNPDLINKVHSSDVVDVSALMSPPDAVLRRLSEESILIACNKTGSKEGRDDVYVPSDEPMDLEIYEMEEDLVTDWEVLTREHSAASPATPHSYAEGFKPPGNLAAIVLHKILSSFTILSDTESSALTEREFKPETFLPLVGHPSADVHTPSLDLIGLILERSNSSNRAKFTEDGGYSQLAALLQDSSPSSPLLSSVLSVLHGHPVDINVPFELNKLNPPQIKLAAVCLLPPLIVSSLSFLSLGHNLLCHVHELLANLPEFTRSLMSLHLLQTLVAGLIKVGDLPGLESDIFGCNESELLTEDIYNILRMLVVFFADKLGKEYEDLLDILFLGSGILNPASQLTGKPKLGNLSEGSALSLRAGVCLLLEEILLTLEAGLARLGDRPTPLKYFQKEEFQDVDQEPIVFKPSKGKQAGSSVLVSRLNQITKFSVNYLTSRCTRLMQQEETLALSILNLCLDVSSRKSSSSVLVKGLNDAPSLGGILVLHLLKYGSEKMKAQLLRSLDARTNILPLFQEMFPDPSTREHLRLCVLNTMKSSQVFCSSEDSKRVTLFYGRILTKALFPEGPQTSFQPTFPVHHTSYGPWKAECFRCVSLFLSQVNQDSKKKSTIATRFTERVVERHDLCRKYFLEQGRDRISGRQKSLRSWRRIIGNQTHPLALWHDPAFEPQSLVLENVTGLSGTYIRFKRAHSGIYKDKFYKEGFKYKSEEESRRYAFLLGDKESEENLTNKLDYPEQIQLVEVVKEVTPTHVLDCDLVVSQDTLHIFSSCSWTTEMAQLESISKRRYQLKHIALEFFLRSGENHLIVFKNQEYRENFVKLMQENGVVLNPKSDYLQTLTKKWKQGLITNFHYLTELNSLAGRTPNDLMQYPVFPWILADYTSPHLNLTEPSAFRNLRRPIAIQDEKNKEKYETTYRLLDQEGTGLPSHMGPYHYASHYSNTGIVLHLLVRLPPFTHEFIKFQDGNFDLADRSFHSLATSWQMVSHVSTSDVKELIPQLFYLPEMFENNEGYALGKRQNGKDVDSVALPPWAPDARIFVKIHRQALESSFVKQEISHWIDLVFGYKQRGTAAVEAINVFHPATYAHNLDQAEDELEKRARQTMIATYGQTPLQLFTSPHPLADIDLNIEKYGPTSVYRTVTGLKWGNYVGSPAYPPPYVVWQQAQPFLVRSLLRLESNQVVGLPANTVLVDNFNSSTGDGSFLVSAHASSANLVSWGHGDSALYCRQGKQGEETQIALLPINDQVVIGASDPKVSTLWLGHASGRISVFKYVQKEWETKLKLVYVSTLYGHMSDITSLVLSPHYSLAVSSCSQGYVSTWDLHSQTGLHFTSVECRRPDSGQGGATNVLCAISESCGDIAVAANSTLTLYTVNLNKVCQTTIRGNITALTFSHLEEGKSVNSILIGTQSGGVRLYSSWDLTHMRDVVGCLPSPITALCFSLDCLSLVVSTKNSFVTIFEKSGSHGINRTPKYISLQ